MLYFYLYQSLKYEYDKKIVIVGGALSQESLRITGLLASFIFKDHMK